MVHVSLYNIQIVVLELCHPCTTYGGYITVHYIQVIMRNLESDFSIDNSENAMYNCFRLRANALVSSIQPLNYTKNTKINLNKIKARNQ